MQVVCRFGGQRLLLLRRERDAERLGDLPRNLVLYLEHVLHLPVVSFRPERKVGRRVDQLRVDPQSAPCAPQASRERVGRLELLADLRWRDWFVAIGQHGGARENVQASDFR